MDDDNDKIEITIGVDAPKQEDDKQSKKREALFEKKHTEPPISVRDKDEVEDDDERAKKAKVAGAGASASSAASGAEANDDAGSAATIDSDDQNDLAIQDNEIDFGKYAHEYGKGSTAPSPIVPIIVNVVGESIVESTTAIPAENVGKMSPSRKGSKESMPPSYLDYEDETVASPPVDPSKLGGNIGFQSWAENGNANGFIRAYGRTGTFSFKSIRVICPPRRSVYWNPKTVNPFSQCIRECCNRGASTPEGFVALERASGYMLPGKSVLVLGAPGSGKSTLLRVLAGRLHPHHELIGEIHVNGKEVDVRSQNHRRLTSYVSGDADDHLSALTVRETFWFAASCAGSGNWPGIKRSVKIKQAVDAMLTSLGLTEVADIVIGGSSLRGISAAQRRRVSFGEVLFAAESPFLFLDDITNGLDTASAAQIMGIVKSCCNHLKFSALVALLQPQPELFAVFDNVLVLTPRGETAYFGPAGSKCIQYFEGRVAQGVMPDVLTESEFILLACSHFRPEDHNGVTLARTFELTNEGKEFANHLNDVFTTPVASSGFEFENLSKYATSRLQQFVFTCHRRMVLILRNPTTIIRLGSFIILGFIIGSLFTSLGNDLVSSFAKISFLFLSSFLCFFIPCYSTLVDNFQIRTTFHKHRQSEFFSTPWFYIANMLTDIPLAILEITIYSVLVYFWSAMKATPGSFFYFWGVLIFLNVLGQSIGRLISNLCPTEMVAVVTLFCYGLVSALVCGYLPFYTSIGWWWRWLNWITPLSYAYEGLVINEFTGQAVQVLDVQLAGSTTVQTKSITGEVFLDMIGLPRAYIAGIPGSDEYQNVIGFDIGMLIVLKFFVDVAAVLALDLSIKLYAAAHSPGKGFVRGGEYFLVDRVSFMKAVSESLPIAGLRSFSSTSQRVQRGDIHNDDADKQNLAIKDKGNSVPIDETRPKRTGSKAVLVIPPANDISLAVMDISYFADPVEATCSSIISCCFECTLIKSKKDKTNKKKRSVDVEAQDGSCCCTKASCKRTASQIGFNTNDEVVPSAEVLGMERRWLRFPSHYGQNKSLSIHNLLLSMMVGKHSYYHGKDMAGEFDDGFYDIDRMEIGEDNVTGLAGARPLQVRRPRRPSRRGRAWTNKRPTDAIDDFEISLGRLKLVDDVTAVFRKARLTAVFGESGCGKSIFLDIIAGLKRDGEISGDIYVFGEKTTPEKYNGIVGYVEQCDIHNPYLTVEESIYFAAECRLPKSIDKKKKISLVEEVMDVLNLLSFRNICVGKTNLVGSIPAHARKRLSIAVSIVTGAQILLLDEPTVGMDSVSADIVMSSLRRAAERLGITVIATVQQPSRSLIAKFDDILLLRGGGQVVYQGPSIYIIDYFTGLGAAPMAPGGNAADHAVRAISALDDAGIDAAEMYQSSPESKAIWTLVEEIIAVANEKGESNKLVKKIKASSPTKATTTAQPTNDNDDVSAKNVSVPSGTKTDDLLDDEDVDPNDPNVIVEDDGPFAQILKSDVYQAPRPSACDQISVLIWRQFNSSIRNPNNMLARLFWAIFGAFFVGTIFIRLDTDVEGALLRVAAVFYCAFVIIFPLEIALEPAFDERVLVYREQVNSLYNKWSFALAQIIAELPVHAVSSVCFFVIFYYTAGFRVDTSESQGYFFIMSFFNFWLVYSFIQLSVFLSPNFEVAHGFVTLVIILSVLLMGLLISYILIHPGWLWVTWINMLNYFLQGLSVNEISGLYFALNTTALVEQGLINGPGDKVSIYTPYGPSLVEVTAADFPTYEVSGTFILASFGWATFNEATGSYIANQEWYYCILATCIFIICIELLKALSIRYASWTTR